MAKKEIDTWDSDENALKAVLITGAIGAIGLIGKTLGTTKSKAKELERIKAEIHELDKKWLKSAADKDRLAALKKRQKELLKETR